MAGVLVSSSISKAHSIASSNFILSAKASYCFLSSASVVQGLSAKDTVMTFEIQVVIPG